jgi:hypothetical protein
MLVPRAKHNYNGRDCAKLIVRLACTHQRTLMYSAKNDKIWLDSVD